jgi:hypothetical protein
MLRAGLLTLAVATTTSHRRSEITFSDQSTLKGALYEPRALLVLRDSFDRELLKKETQMGLYRVDAQDQVGRDLLVCRRSRKLTGVLERSAQGDEHFPLRLREVGREDRFTRDGGRAGRTTLK